MVAELRRAADEWRANHPSVSTFEMRYDLALKDAADAIEELQAGEKKFLRNISVLEMENEKLKRARRWIPVTERLPGREWVLCKCRAKIHEVLSLRDGYWYHDPQHQYMSGFVTHWMPLPEPPREET